MGERWCESDGVQWLIDDDDHDILAIHHETSLTPHVLSLLPAGGGFLDVGAHVGHYALRAAGKASVVWAVECNPDTAARLRQNVQFNGFRNVHVIQVAAWNGIQRFDMLSVRPYWKRDGSARVIPSENGPVWGARLDDAMSQYPLRPDRLDLIKLDVEGADLQAIDGMRGLIAKHQPVLFIEDHSTLGYYKQEDLLALIEDLGYGYEKVEWEAATYWQCAPAQDASSPARSS